jgi:hypothetical protein
MNETLSDFLASGDALIVAGIVSFLALMLGAF